MASNLEEEPMEIDNQDDEEETSPTADTSTVLSETGSKDDEIPGDLLSTESVDQIDEGGKKGFQDMEEITLNEGGVGEGEEAEELQLHLNAPDFGDEGGDNEQLFGNEDSNVSNTDNFDDPLSRQNDDESAPDILESDEPETRLEKGESEGMECLVDLLNTEDAEEDNISVPINEPGDPYSAKSVEENGNEQEDPENDKDKDNSSENPICIDDEPLKNESKTNDDEVIALDADEGPTIRLRMDGIFEQREEEHENDDDDDEDRLMDIQSMMQMNFQEDGQDPDKETEIPKSSDEVVVLDEGNEGTPTRRHLPRRAAAAAAANTIREISNVEFNVDEPSSRRGRREYDKTFKDPRDHDSRHTGTSGTSSSANKKTLNKCAMCKKYATCPIKIQQFGTELHLCSKICFNKMRHPGKKQKLSCVKCGIYDQADNQTYYWETMNFCSDLCVGNYQVEVGGKCATCYKKVPWLSLGKYCVRFGSDIRQFCTPLCLESYKKNARVCFHCQLDIKRLGNVILANIPSKTTPKEFCSQDCVEMYVEQNLHQTLKAKSNQWITCIMCSEYRTTFREIILPSGIAMKVCSQKCWGKMVEAKRFTNPIKCEKCTKYINLEDNFEPPAHYIATEEKMFCFCSPTCKNVFVLNNRQILSCTTCKVKKYNYDLVQYFNNRVFSYAVCSLNCLPKTADYIISLKSTLLPPSSASEMVIGNGSPAALNEQGVGDNGSFPVISSVTSVSTASQNGGISGLVEAHMQSIANSVTTSNNSTTYTMPQGMEIFNDSTVVEDYEAGDFQYSDDSNWDGILRESDVIDFLDQLKPPPEMKSRSTMARPKMKVMETQTDVSELDDMDRVPLKIVEKIRYIPIPVPYPIYLPSPTYLCETPIPRPFAVPIPVPIPIPIIFNGESGMLHISEISAAKSISEKLKEREIQANNENSGIESSNDIEVMDCTDPNSMSGTDSPLPILPTTFTNTLSPTPTQTSSTISTNSANALHLSSSNITLLSGNETASSPGGGRRKLSRVEYGIRAWKMQFGSTSDPLIFSSEELAGKLAEWVNKGTKPNGERYRADIMLYLCLGVQQHLRESQRPDSIFYDLTYRPFVEAITNYAEADCAQGIITRIEDSHFWDSQELGGSSPGVLLFSLIYFIFKNFNLRTWEKHFALHFGQIKMHNQLDSTTGVKYKCMSIADVPECEGISVRESVNATEKCPVRLLELYIHRCEQPDGAFYKAISQRDFKESPKWYSSDPLDKMEIYQMLTRAMMIKTDSDPR